MSEANRFDFNRMLDDLAMIEHEQWAFWAGNLLEEEEGISDERRERWMNLIETPWEQLSDDLKEFDYLWARRVVDVLTDDAWANIVLIGEIILAKVYPEDVFVGKVKLDPDADPGPQYIAALRAALEYVKGLEK